jgi:hypothetical protein
MGGVKFHYESEWLEELEFEKKNCERKKDMFLKNF